jgi:DnaK suppressor protein
MNIKVRGFDKAFIRQQRERLDKLQNDLTTATQAEESEETQLQDQSRNAAQESEDDAQKLTQLEIGGELVSRNLQRLEPVERALRKIDDGTYGLSDESGEPIPRERLEAMPDAIYTLAEQEAREVNG